MPPTPRQNPRREIDRINSIDQDNCLAILNYVMPKLAEEPMPNYEGNGVVTVAGGRYLRMAFASLKRLRLLDPDIPIEVWHLPGEDMRGAERFEELNVTFRDVGPSFDHEGAWVRNGWSAKAHAIKHSGFRNVLFLDADSAPRKKPNEMFISPEFRSHGLLLWPDVANYNRNSIWPCMGLLYNSVPEHEAGQFLIDKQKAWEVLKLTTWMNGHEFFHDQAMGDRCLWGLAAAKLKYPFLTMPKAKWSEWGISHYWTDGKLAFEHVLAPKRDPVAPPEHIGKLWRLFDSMDISLQPA